MINLIENSSSRYIMGFPSLRVWGIIASIIQPITILVLLGLNFVELSAFFEALVYGLVAGTFGSTTFVIISLYKDRIKNEENSMSTLLPEYREKYYEDFNELLKLIENNTVNTYTKTLIDSLLTLPFGEKRLILQHFFTDEKYLHPHHKLYSSYRKYAGHINAINDDKKLLFAKIIELEHFLTKSTQKYKKSKAWFDRHQLEIALHLEPDTIGHQINYYQDTNFYKKIPHKLELGRDMDDNTVFFTINDVRVGGIASLDDFYKITPKFQEFLRQIKESANDIQVSYNTLDNWFVYWYSNSLSVALEPAKRGKPIIGACEGCIEYFNPKEKAKLQNFLNKFNSTWNNSTEETWRNKKPLIRLFSQIFTKNYSNSFRDSL